jgi:hypothetical protein
MSEDVQFPSVEWHDARITQVCIEPHARVVLHFRWLEVYDTPASMRGEEQAPAWKAMLALDGVTALEGLERGLNEGWVIEGRLLDPTDKEMDAARAIGGVGARALELVLNNGDRVQLSCRRAELTLLSRVKVLDGA